MEMNSARKRVVGISLAAALTFSAFAGIGLASANNNVAAAEPDYLLADSVKDGTILHCFNWKLEDIKAELPNIAKAGFTSVQTSPLQGSPKQGVWYWVYQPLGFEIKDTGLGGEEELRSLCEEADRYGIKVVVDVVANHLAGNNRDQLQSPFEQDAYWHNTGKKVSDSTRTAVTMYDLGAYGDIKSEDSTVISSAKAYIEKLESLGVDGIRWDAAKHIALPSENCEFWTQVTNNSLFHYGEILGTPGGTDAENTMKEYVSIMNITDNRYGDDMLAKFKNGNAPTADGNWTGKGISSDKLVYWGESHDTYANDYNSGSNGVDQNYVDRAYAVATARNAVSLYLSRPLNSIPDQMMFTKKGSMHFTSAEVAAVNHFHNIAGSAADAYGVTDNTSVVTRQGVGAVIVLGSGGNKEVTVENVNSYVPEGTYVDEVTGNTFTVTGNTITGTVGSTGIAVVYNSPFANRVEASPETGTTFEGSMNVTLRAIGVEDTTYTLNYDNGVYNFTDGQIITIGAEAEGGSDVVLTLKGFTPAGDEVTAEYVYSKKVTKNLPQLTKGGVIFDNSTENWDTVNAYVYDELTTRGTVINNGDWPGVAMTDAGNGLFTYEFPEKFKDCKNIMVIFNNGAGKSQVPARDGFLNDYYDVGYYDGGEELRVVQTFERPQESEEESSQESSQESSEESSDVSETESSDESGEISQTSGEVSGETSEVSTTSGEQSGTTSDVSTVSKVSTTSTTTSTTTTTTTTTTQTSTVTATTDQGVKTADATPFAAVAVLAAVSAFAVLIAAKKKHNS